MFHYYPAMFDRCLYFNVNSLARLLNKKWALAFEQFDLSPSHGYMLRVVLAEPGITQKQLAIELILEKSTITRFVDSLQKKGLVTRKAGDFDSREQNIHPTKNAQEIHSSLDEVGDDLYQEMISTIGKTKLVTLVSQLRESAKKLE